MLARARGAENQRESSRPASFVIIACALAPGLHDLYEEPDVRVADAGWHRVAGAMCAARMREAATI